jgi:Tol biopolymer transport system component
MSSKLALRLALAGMIAGVVPACGNINDGHPAVPFTVRASISTAGAQPNLDCSQPVISGDGRFVAFVSAADTLVPGDNNGKIDVFRRNLETGVTELVSIGIGAVPADDDSQLPSISGVAFQSKAGNLTAAGPAGTQVFLRDMNATVGNGVVMVSEVTPGVPGDSASGEPSISADGRFVAFTSFATNFGDTHGNGVSNIYRRDMTTTDIILVSANTSGGDPTSAQDLGSASPSISADGNRVAYLSDCSDLVLGDANDDNDVFVTTILPVFTTVLASPGAPFGAVTLAPQISGNGNFVVYESRAPALVAVDTNTTMPDIFVFDVDGGTVTLVSVNEQGFQGLPTEECHLPSISFDGTFVAFEGSVSNFVPGDTNLANDVFIKDLSTGTVTRVSVDTSGQQSAPVLNSGSPRLSADGRAVVFVTFAAFVKGDDNGLADIYVRSPLR